MAGEWRFLHSYECDGNAIPSFTGEPRRVRIEGDIDTFAATLWENLNEDNKVSLFVRYIPLGEEETQTRIFNKYKKQRAGTLQRDTFHRDMMK